ncbi:MFS transporter [Oscillospiraceae bacterium PP1C4]
MNRNADAISPNAKTGKAFHIQIMFATAFTFLTGGVFLSGFAMYMGASDLLVSYISMITNICGVSILFFSGLIGRFRSFKKITITFTLLSKLATLLIVLIPLFAPKSAQIAVFVPLMLVAFTLQAQTTVVLNNWMVTFVEEKQSGKYISKRQTFVLCVTVLLSIVGGRVLDAVSGAYIGFAILFAVALLMSVMEIAVLLKIPDAVQPKTVCKKSRFSDMFRVPMKCRPYLRFVVYIFLFYLMLSLADSFTVVYMMRYLGLSYTATTLMQMLISLPQLFLLGTWGKISDKKGHQFALKTSIWFFVGETLFMALSSPQNLYAMIPIAFLFAAAANSGFVVSVFNRRYELMPQEGRILYDNFYSAAVGLAFILGPVLGGAIKGQVEATNSLFGIMQFANVRLLYAISTVSIILLQLFFTVKRTKERG